MVFNFIGMMKNNISKLFLYKIIINTYKSADCLRKKLPHMGTFLKRISIFAHAWSLNMFRLVKKRFFPNLYVCAVRLYHNNVDMMKSSSVLRSGNGNKKKASSWMQNALAPHCFVELLPQFVSVV